MNEPRTTTPLRMNAYYFSFGPTGVELVDRVLSAIACAGKAYHHTEDWTEPTDDWPPFHGGTYVDWIYNAAKEAAEAHAEMRSALEFVLANSGDPVMENVCANALAKAHGGDGPR